MRHAIPALACTLAATTAAAQVTEQQLIRQSTAAVSAFACFPLAPTDKEAQRLFQIGLKNGRAFIENAKANPAAYKNVTKEVAVLWGWVTGPTTDFILGQVYWMVVEQATKDVAGDAKSAADRKSLQYASKNCSLISE